MAVAALIVIPMLTLCVSDPLVPVTWSVNEPVDDDEVALTVNVEVAVDPDGGVTGPGRVMDTSDGALPTHE